MMSDPPYRPCVGIMLLNRQGLAFIGRRANKKQGEHVAEGHEWQMPQGGIDAGESPEAAARRELFEETGVKAATLLAEAANWYHYDLPEHLVRSAWKGRFRGQTQKWFAFRFEGKDSDINVLEPGGGEKPEFDAWRWVERGQLVDLIIPFKRKVYEAVVMEFAHLR